MADTGVGVLYVTHHLGEVFRVGNRLSVLRDGILVGSGPVTGVRPPCRSSTCWSARSSRRRRPRRAETSGRSGPRTREPPVLEVEGPARRCGRGRLAVGLAGRDRRDRRPRRVGPRRPARPGVRLVPARPAARSGSAGEDLKPTAGRISRSAAASRTSRRTARRAAGDEHDRQREPDDAQPAPVLEGPAAAAQARAGSGRRSGSSGSGCVRPARSTSRSAIFSGGNQQKVLFGKWLSQDAVGVPAR